MRIEKCDISYDHVWEEMTSCFERFNHETGGILGETEGVLNSFFFDMGISSVTDEYEPDTVAINRCLRRWSESGITFVGMIHTHFSGENLSYADIEYAKQIMGINGLKKVLMPIYLMGQKRIISYIVFQE